MDSIRCSHWPEQGRQCLAPAYETLRELCMNHYRELVIKPTWQKYCALEAEWHRVQLELFNVECALGYRGEGMRKNIATMIRQDTDKRLLNDFQLNPPRQITKQIVRHSKPNEHLIDDEDL